MDDGDANDDGFVNGDDFLTWQQQFGSGVGIGASTTTIPEPPLSLPEHQQAK